MVGVPKRARGCEACRKRRLKCDHKRPTCSECENISRDCRYPNAFTFVVNDPGTHRTVYKKKPIPDRLKSPTSNNDTPKTNVTIEVSKTPPPTYTVEERFTSTALVHSIPQHVSNIAAMQQQLLSYALHRFTTQNLADIALIQIWVPTLQQFAASSNALKSSPLACCAAWIARTDRDPSTIDFSQHLYAEGLHEVRTALRSPRTMLDDETLGACLALAAFEVSECPAQCRVAYQWHRRASVNLVQMRGAKRHREGVGHELFLAARLHGIFYAYEQKKPNFLCTREWSTVPWEFTPKDDVHRLADILAKGPQLLHEAEALSHKPFEQSLPTLLTILSRLLDIDEELDSYYHALLTDNAVPLFWKAPTSEFFAQSGSSDASKSPARLEFADQKTASLLSLYWSIATMVWSALETIHAGLVQSHTLHLLPDSPRAKKFKALAPNRHWLDLVRNILRSVDYCMDSTSEPASPPGIGIALEIIIDTMRPKTACEVEYKRAVEARDEMGRRWAAILLS